MNAKSGYRAFGVVVIGRNEGERLVECLESLRAAGTIVYVDSGSTDRSVEVARDLGAEVVNLDTSIPFTAGRARNEGFKRLIELDERVPYVHFVDGDCELVEGWMDIALATLEARPDVAVVCGRREERFPEHSAYNAICDMEWDGPIGEIRECGGDCLMRAAAFVAAGGFRLGMIAGEEPELCKRLRDRGWKILRLDEAMTRHDADMHRFGQWWRRATRSGHAYAECAWLHGASEELYCVRNVASILAWGLVLPAAALAIAWPTRGWSLALILAYLVPLVRAWSYRREKGDSLRPSLLYAMSCVLGKIPEAAGVLRYLLRQKILRRPGKIIEYKEVEKA